MALSTATGLCPILPWQGMAKMLWAESMELVGLGGGRGNPLISYRVSCLINSKLVVGTAFQTPPEME